MENFTFMQVRNVLIFLCLLLSPYSPADKQCRREGFSVDEVCQNKTDPFECPTENLTKYELRFYSANSMPADTPLMYRRPEREAEILLPDKSMIKTGTFCGYWRLKKIKTEDWRLLRGVRGGSQRRLINLNPFEFDAGSSLLLENEDDWVQDGRVLTTSVTKKTSTARYRIMEIPR